MSPRFARHSGVIKFRVSGDKMEFTEVRDSGERELFETGSRRDTRKGKGRYDLLPPYALKRLAVHFELGSTKYGEHNWTKGQPLSRYLDSALRHLFTVLDGDTNEDHAIACVWNMLAFVQTQEMIKRGRLPEALNDLYDWGGNVVKVEDAPTTDSSIS